MNSIIVSANKDKFFTSLFSMLNEHYSLIKIKDKSITLTDNSDFLITGSDNFSNIISTNSILIFKDFTEIDIDLVQSQKKVAVVDSSDHVLLEKLANLKIPAITCGLSRLDTITLSSISIDRIVLNIQRGFEDFCGNFIEPQEIPVNISGENDNFLIMAVLAVFILNGNKQKLFEITL